MRIAFIITQAQVIGGASIHVRDLSKSLLLEGHDVFVLVGGTGPFTEQLEEHGIPFISLENCIRQHALLKDIKCYFEIKKILLKLKPDIVTVHSAKAGVLGRLAARKIGIPVVYTVHGWPFTEGIKPVKRLIYAHVERVMANFSDQIITVSNYDRQLALDLRIAPEELMETIHNGIPDVEPSFFAVPEKDPPRIIMTARFEEPKDQISLIKALATLKKFPWYADFLGDGPLISDSMKFAQNLGLDNRLFFHGSVNDVHRYLSKAQIFALSTKWEGLPLTILEAMRAGLPVIATNVGGIREAVVNSENGFLVGKQDELTLATALEKLITTPLLRKQMGGKGRDIFEKEFSWNNFKSKTHSTFISIAHSN